MTRVSLVSLLMLTACLGEGKVAVTPVSTPPASTPTPPVPTTPLPPTLPSGSTLLVDIPTQEWPIICEHYAMAQDAIDLDCPNLRLELPARDEAADAVACLSYFQVAAEWTGCEATFSDFEVMTNFIPTCAPLPAEVTRILECVNPPPPTPPTPPPVCESVFDWSPGSGALNVIPTTDLEWNFSASDSSAVVELEDDAGNLVPGTTSWNGSVLTFVPDDPLGFGVDYTSRVTFCDDFENFFSTFTTSSVGPVVPPADLPGRVYGIDLSDPNIDFVEPAGVGALLQSQLGGIGLMLEIETASADEIELMGALSDTFGFTQDLCTPTVDLPVSDFTTNPYFEAGPADVPLSFTGIEVTLTDTVIEGAVPPTGDSLFLTLDAAIDTRPLVDLFSPGGGDNAVCDLMLAFGINCVPCSGAGGDFCLNMRMENISAVELIGNPIVERTEADVTSDPTCTPAP